MTSISVLPKGTNFTRYAAAIASAGGKVSDAAEIASSRWGSSSVPAMLLRAAVQAGTTDGTGWGEELGALQAASSDFMDVVRPQTIIGRLPGLRRVPLNLRIPLLASGSTAYWVGEGKPVPVSALQLSAGELAPKKIAGLIVMTDEVLRMGGPVAERLVRDDLARQVVQLSDLSFIDAGNAGSEFSPASITNAATSIPSTGTALGDVKALIAAFDGDLATAAFITDPKTAAAMNSTALPDVGARGGSALGIPVITSGASPRASGIGRLALVDAAGILMGEGPVDIRASRQASVQMVDNPASPPDASTVFVSLFQINATALMATQVVNWQVARAGSVLVIEDASY